MAASAIGAAAGLAGSLISSRSAKKAAGRAADAAAFNPYNTSNLFGSVSWDQRTGRINQNLNAWADRYGQQLRGALQGTSPFAEQAGLLQGMGAGDIAGAYGAANAYGMPTGVQQGLSGLFSMAGINPAAQEQMALGRGLLGNNYSDVAEQRLGLLREQAAPFEQRATDSLFNRLYGQGRMGSTGGGRDIESFARGLGQADTSRQLEAQGFAEQLYGRDQAIGAQLFSGGAGNWLQGLGTAGSLGQQLIGLNQMGYSRANDRIARAEGLFGFGGALGQDYLNQNQTILNQLGFLSGQQQALTGLSADVGKMQASAGANQAQYLNQMGGSPFGGFLQGIGGGLLTGDLKLPSWGGTSSSGTTGMSA